ncbi:ATPase-like protein [Metarhizium anisopliae]|nr:ATPase-like protein [Metarhizium anisopliae]
MGAYATLYLSLLILCCTGSTKSRALFITSSALPFASAMWAMPLSLLEHAPPTTPSILLNGFLLLAIILDIGQTRILSSASSPSDEAAFSRLFTTSVAVKAVMLVLKSWKKSKWVRWDGNKHSPEETAGVFGLCSLAWLNPLLLAGYKKRLALENLYPLDSNLASEHLEVNHPPVSTVCAVALGNVTVWPER